MAERDFRAKVTLQGIDRASGEFNKVDNSMRNTIRTIGDLVVGSAAIAGVISIIKNLSAAGAAEEIAQRRLAIAVDLAGISWRDSKEYIEGWIASIQAATLYSDSDLRPALQKMITFTGDLETAMEGVTIALDLASAGFFGLDSAITYMGLAMEGNVEMLGRYIPQLKAANLNLLGITDAADKTDYALTILKEKMGGMATGELATFTGEVTIQKERIDDLKEVIGRELNQSLAMWLSLLVELVDKMGTINRLGIDRIDIAKKQIEAEETRIAQIQLILLNEQLSTEEQISLMDKLVESQRRVAGLRGLIEEDITRKKEEEIRKREALEIINAASSLDLQQTLGNSILMNSEKTTTAIELNMDTSLKKQQALWSNWAFIVMETHTALYDTIIENVVEFVAEYAPIVEALNARMISLSNAYESLERARLQNSIEDKKNAEWVKYNAEKNRIETSTEDNAEMLRDLELLEIDYNRNLVAIEKEGQEESRKIKEEYKKWGIAEATISGLVASAKALTQAPFPANLILAAAVLAEAVAKVELIKTQRFAAGTRGARGGYAMIGEEGAELMNVPAGADIYSAQQTRNIMRGAGGGGRITIINDIHDNVIADEESVDNLSDKISDNIMYKLQTEINV